jgi:hypothetical protein
MKLKPSHLGGLITVGLLSQGSAQGLLSMGADDDFYSGLPFTTSISGDVGWDSNPASLPYASSGTEYLRGGIDVAYGSGNRTTPVKVGASLSTLYYTDKPEGLDDDTFYNVRITLNLKHDVNRRLTIGDNFYVAYEIEPDLAVGASAQRRDEQYLYGYNSAWASYAWNRQLSSVTRYTASGIRYDDGELSASEDRLTHTVSQEIRYQLSRVTALVGEYRFTYTDFDSSNHDYTSHHILAGADHDFARDLKGHLRAGVELRRDDYRGNVNSPYGEFALRKIVTDDTNLHWVNRFGLEDSELGTFGKRSTYRSTLSLNHILTARLRGNASVSYLHNEFKNSDVQSDYAEDLLSAQIGMAYRIQSNVDVNAGYTYTGVTSDDQFREYDRHRVSLGLSATF